MMINTYFKCVCGLFVCLLFSSIAVQAGDALIFSAPPRESLEQGNETYKPIAEFLTKFLGKEVIYEQPSDWSTYTTNMRKDKYDFLFDGPHFVSWRIKFLDHEPVVKIPGNFVFTIVAKKQNSRVNRITDLVAKKVCGHAPPNHGTLRLFDQLDNPMRQPIVIAVRGWRNIYKAMMRDECEAAILPLKIYKEMDPNENQSKIIFITKTTAGQAITVSKKFNTQFLKKIRTALLTEEGQAATKNLQKRFASPPLTAAKSSEYTGVHKVLRHTYGFDDYKYGIDNTQHVTR